MTELEIFLEFSFVAHTMSKNPGCASYQHLGEKDYGTRPSVASKLISRDRWRFGNLKQRVCIFVFLFVSAFLELTKVCFCVFDLAAIKHFIGL